MGVGVVKVAQVNRGPAVQVLVVRAVVALAADEVKVDEVKADRAVQVVVALTPSRWLKWQ